MKYWYKFLLLLTRFSNPQIKELAKQQPDKLAIWKILDKLSKTFGNEEFTVIEANQVILGSHPSENLKDKCFFALFATRDLPFIDTCVEVDGDRYPNFLAIPATKLVTFEDRKLILKFLDTPPTGDYNDQQAATTQTKTT